MTNIIACQARSRHVPGTNPTQERFRLLLRELIDDNPFAIRAVLQVLDVEFTDEVSTLAVTCEERPRLLVNAGFVERHCRTDAHVKAVICHEFLHVLLRHTEARTPLGHARHIAFDAVINAIIHREMGEDFSSMMAAYYGEAKDLRKLLRPMTAREAHWLFCHPREMAEDRFAWVRAWKALYDGLLVADDIEALAGDLRQSQQPHPAPDGTPDAGTPDAGTPDAGKPGPDSREDGSGGLPDDCPFRLEPAPVGDSGDGLLGDHDSLGADLPDAVAQALDKAMKQMNGAGIWRSPPLRGVGANPYQALFAAGAGDLSRWRQRTFRILKRHLTADPRSRSTRPVPRSSRLPVLSSGDRRAALRATWSPFLPEALWHTHAPVREGSAQVYLDVSGSMSAEMPLIVGLLAPLSRHIRRPFWAFSDVVAPAVIENGLLRAETTGGTSMSCVIEHVIATKPEAAVVVTDGYIEPLDPGRVRAIGSTRLHVLIIRNGNAALIERAGLPYTQLDKVPS